MNVDELLEQLAGLPNRIYSYIALLAVVGPLTLRVFGFAALSRVVRPLALAVLLAGMYAKQEHQRR